MATMTKATVSAAVEHEWDALELLSAVFDNLWCSTSPWVYSTNFSEHKGPDQAVRVEFVTDHDSRAIARINAQQLANAVVEVVKAGEHHCGELVSLNIETWDACCSDIVLQQAVLGKVIYG